MKKIITLTLLVITSLVILSGCQKEENIELSMNEVVDKLYVGLEDNMPMVGSTEITKDNMKSYIGIDNLDIKEGVASEALIGSIAHSVVVLRVSDKVDVEKAKNDIKENANPRKWVCVEAEKVIVKSKGDVIILIMSNNELAPKIESNFDNL